MHHEFTSTHFHILLFRILYSPVHLESDHHVPNPMPHHRHQSLSKGAPRILLQVCEPHIAKVMLRISSFCEVLLMIECHQSYGVVALTDFIH